MVNSTRHGGGVAEMLPRMIGLLEDLGIDARWYVMECGRSGFFDLTKHLHNLIHDHGRPALGSAQRALYDSVSHDGAEALRPELRPGDILVVHDPQPAGAGALVRRDSDILAVWRCHIGHERTTASTRSAWEFLQSGLEAYDAAVFSAPEYIPAHLAGRSRIIQPGIDPLGHKNRELSAHKLVGILCNAQLSVPHHPVLTPQFENPVRRVMPDGSLEPAAAHSEIGLLYRPIVTQVSRWDRLKGFLPLMEGFARLKRSLDEPGNGYSPRQIRRLQIVRLVLAGPEPGRVDDDPEGKTVFQEIVEAYRALGPGLQQDIAVLQLPMASRKNNALIVNALQRCATVVVQNSLREGFGLTVTEAMWKRRAVVTTHACGPRHQVRDRIDGRLIDQPEDPRRVASVVGEVLGHPALRSRYALSAQRRAHDEFLVFSQLRRWLRLWVDLARGTGPREGRSS